MPIARFSDSRYYLNYTVTSGTQSIPNNNTVVTSFLQIVKDGSASGWSNNTSYWYTGYPSSTSGTFTYNFGGTTTLTLYNNGKHTVGHNADGTKSFSTSASVNADTPLGSASIGSFNVTLPTIPRASTPTVTGGSLTTGVSSTINMNRASSSFTHNVTYSIGSLNGTIATGVGANTTWNPPHSLLTAIPNATSGTVTITVVTKNGSTTIGTKTLKVTLNANASQVPTVSAVSWADTNTTVNSNIGASIYVQGRSIMRATVTAAGIQGSTIPVDLKGTVVDGVSYPDQALIPITKSGTIVATGVATDTRGRSASREANFTVLPYTPPTLGANGYSVSRANSSYAADPGGTYAFVNLHVTATTLKSGSTEKNYQTIVISTRLRGTTSWVVRKTVSGALSYNGKINIDGAQGGNIFLGDKSYDFKIEVYDRTEVYPPVSGEKTSIHLEEVLSTTKVALDIYGSRLGIGKMVENGTLDVLGDVYATAGGYFSGDVYSRGTTDDDKLVRYGDLPSELPAGSIMVWTTTVVPPGWLLCDGSEVSRSTYSDLFAVIGTTYGAGDGTTTFKLPDLRGRTVVGVNSGDSEFNALNKKAGAKTHTLTTGQMPSHTHTVRGPIGGDLSGAGGGGSGYTTGAGHAPWFGGGWSAVPAVIGSAGSGQAHNNIQPSIALNYIIKAAGGLGDLTSTIESILLAKVALLEAQQNDVHWERAYAPDRVGALPTSEASAMLSIERDMPVKPYPQIATGIFTGWFNNSSSGGTKIFHAGIQVFGTGTNPARDSHSHATIITTDTVTTARSVSLPFTFHIAANDTVSLRGLQWGSYPGSASTADGNGISFEITVR